MKRIAIIFCCLIPLIIACGTNQGLQLAKEKEALVIKGIQNIDGYNSSLKVVAADSLYMDGPPSDDKLRFLKKRKNGDYVLDGAGDKASLPKYVFQVKDAVFTPNDYLWAAGVGSDYRVQTLQLGKMSTGQKKGEMSLKTFDIDGSELMAVDVSDGKTVAYQPYKLSFMLSGEVPETLVLYSYNCQDMIMIYLDESTMVGNSRVKSVVIDLNYGNQFTFITADGRFPNISPQLLKKIDLEGNLSLSKNNCGGQPFYLFEVTGGKLPNTGQTSCSINGDCSNYQNLKLPPARQASDANYPNGYIRLDVCDVYKNDKSLFQILLSNGAIGFDKSQGRNQTTVRISPQSLRSLSPKLWERYKNKIIKP